MIKTRSDSVIEIWSDDYINGDEPRQFKDADAAIVQIEVAQASKGNYIVEVVRKKRGMP